jgi:hypothetical protein
MPAREDDTEIVCPGHSNRNEEECWRPVFSSDVELSVAEIDELRHAAPQLAGLWRGSRLNTPAPAHV